MNAMKYKGYAARIEFDADDRIFVGHLTGIRDIIGFHGSSVVELENAFHEAVDDYLAACAKLGQHPHVPASGKMFLRVPPEVHSAAIMAEYNLLLSERGQLQRMLQDIPEEDVLERMSVEGRLRSISASLSELRRFCSGSEQQEIPAATE